MATFGKHEISATTDNTSVWRIKLPPTPATKSPQTIAFKASTGETAVLSDVLFGDVYVCGGQVCVICKISRQKNCIENQNHCQIDSQCVNVSMCPSTIRTTSHHAHLPRSTYQSNMQFSIGANENGAYYRQEANNYPDIRLFTVGQNTSSRTPLMDLQTIGQSSRYFSMYVRKKMLCRKFL